MFQVMSRIVPVPGAVCVPVMLVFNYIPAVLSSVNVLGGYMGMLVRSKQGLFISD